MDKSKDSFEDSSKKTKRNNEQFSVKRSYTLRPSTVKKLQELKVFHYDNPSITYNEIVDSSICLFYEKKKCK